MFPRGGHIHERFLRHLWSRQYLRSAELSTTDGVPVSVLDAGVLNPDGGPDVRNARIRIGHRVFAGDVEIHRNVVEWIQHHHEADAAYNKVILHVVLEGDPKRYPTVVQSGRRIPVLLLEPFLSESLRSLWHKAILDERATRAETIPCHMINGEISAQILEPWIRKLAIERMELKLRRFEERLRELAAERMLRLHEPWKPYGAPRVEGFPEEIPPPASELTHKELSHRGIWEQVLFEGIMDGLGYSKNRDPFVRLARTVTLSLIRFLKLEADAVALQAVLFGASGLLPKIGDMKEKDSKSYVRSLVRMWNHQRKNLRIGRLHRAEWQFFPTRPSNFPTVRIASASSIIHKLLNEDFFRNIIQTVKSPDPAPDKHRYIRSMLSARTKDFWSRHYDFDTPAGRVKNILGGSRIDDIICNAVLPVCMLYARVFRDAPVREGVIQLLEFFPPLSDNSITRLMTAQLLKGKLKLERMSLQQGVIQLYKYYCLEKRCRECEVGKRVFGP